MIYLTHEEPRATMNIYGIRIRDRWKTTAPSRYAALPDPESYFEDLGNLVAGQVDRLSTRLEGSASAGETYLQAVARLSTAKRQAEELVMSELDWPTIELSASADREEWEANQTPDEWLLDWATSLHGPPFQDELEDLSRTWMLPVSFLEELASSTSPSTYLATHSEMMTSSRNDRYLRDRN